MMRFPFRKSVSLRILLGVLALVAYAAPGSAVYGVRRRTAAVAYGAGATTSAAAASSAAASKAAAAAQQQQRLSSRPRPRIRRRRSPPRQPSRLQRPRIRPPRRRESRPAAPKTMQQKLEELQSLYKQGLITESEYSAQKAKILAEGSQ